MKNLLIIAFALFTLNAAAQKHQTRQNDRKAGSEMMKQMTPKERADLQTKKLTLHLDLSDAQQEKVHAIILNQANINENRRKAWKSSKTDENFKPSKDSVLKMRNDKLDQQIQMKRDMKAILTPEQYEKFEKSLESKQNKRNKKFRKHQKKQ